MVILRFYFSLSSSQLLLLFAPNYSKMLLLRLDLFTARSSRRMNLPFFSSGLIAPQCLSARSSTNSVSTLLPGPTGGKSSWLYRESSNV